MKLPKAILFDLDDTLIRAYAQPEEAWGRLLHVFAAHLDAHDAVAIARIRTAIMEESRAFWNDQAAAAKWRLNIPEARRLATRAGLRRLGRDDDALADRIADLEPHRQREIIIHCHHGGRSLRVANWLRRNGFEGARSMAGGIDQWSLQIDPSIPRY